MKTQKCFYHRQLKQQQQQQQQQQHDINRIYKNLQQTNNNNIRKNYLELIAFRTKNE